MDGQEPGDQKQSTADMTVFVQNLLGQMQSRFQTMSNSIGKVHLNCRVLDEMGSRIGELEQSINNLKAEMGVENEPTERTEEKAPATEPPHKDQ
ncbi:unnamed protein product [Spirodela intermedia]|uniref:Uncharacterized protein n=1 Tax=Spirodela intermedia TaxID=51605 RepID=A0A7I8KVX4_SPIIN|nr:unnamed protein product [Spirodela intermedia]